MFQPVDAISAVEKCSICLNPTNTNRARPDGCCHLFHYDCIYRSAIEEEATRAYLIQGQEVRFLPGAHCPLCRTTFFAIIRVMDPYTKDQKKYMNTPRPCKIIPEFREMFSVKDPRYISKMRSFDAKNGCCVMPAGNDNSVGFESNENQQVPPQAQSDCASTASSSHYDSKVPPLAEPDCTPTASSSHSDSSMKIVAHLYCFVCNKAFNSTAAKSMHSQRHKQIEIKCSICNKKYSNRSNLAQHKRKNH